MKTTTRVNNYLGNLLIFEDDFVVETFDLLDVLVVDFGGFVTVEYILHLLVKSGSIFIITGYSWKLVKVGSRILHSKPLPVN